MNYHDHPCFSETGRHTAARIHLPVAPACNMQCNYCDRDYSCVNESRPGVTSAVLSPFQAADYLDEVMSKIENMKVVGIAGPGDPFANAEETLRTLRLVRERHPGVMLCVATNGLDLLPHVQDLASVGVSHVTVTVNAVDPDVGSRIYSWARYGKRIYRGLDAARIILDRQREAVMALKKMGIIVKINTVVIPGVNEDHVVDVARRMAELGADIQNCIPMYHVMGTAFQNLTPLSGPAMETVRSEASVHMSQMSHCSRCRADAAGMVGEIQNEAVAELLRKAVLPRTTKERPLVAVASMEGLFVNQHLGEAKGLWIYGVKDGKADLLERRASPPPGGGFNRWKDLADSLEDCSAVLTSGVGPSPQTILEGAGIRVVVMEGLAKEGVDAILAGREIPKILLRPAGRCGIGKQCTGNGTGCG
jgi:nitrogen fixation protein NifB